MILLFDIGNSRLKWAVARAGQITAGSVMDVAHVSSKSLAEQFADLARPDSIWVSNVGAKTGLKTLLNWLEARFKLKASVARVDQSACGINNGYRDFTSLGVDRWLAAIGARSKYLIGDVIIVDVGTAVTIDWLSAQSIFEGGAILPGLSLMHGALVDHTAEIKSDYIEPRQIIGHTTQECVNSGVAYGLSGAVERIVEEMQTTIDRPVHIFLTGGGAYALAEKTRLEAEHDPNLVFIGLLELALESTNEQEL